MVADPTDIAMWCRIDERLTTSGQPERAQLAGLRDIGVAHVVNLGLHSHPKALPDEAHDVAELGMAYLHMPVDFNAPTDADYERFSAIMREFDGQIVHIHCIANLRVSAFLYRYRRTELGWAEEKARAAMEQIWRPGGIWAAFIGDDAEAQAAQHLYAGRDY